MVCGLVCLSSPPVPPGQPVAPSRRQPLAEVQRSGTQETLHGEEEKTGPLRGEDILGKFSRVISRFVSSASQVQNEVVDEDWVNGLMELVWPYVTEALRKMTEELLIPEFEALLQNLPIVNQIRIVEWDLGSAPPRVVPISVYRKDMQEIPGFQMDARVQFDSDVNCRMAFGHGATAISISLTKFKFDGIVSLVGKPLLHEMPIIGGAQLFCLNDPSYDLTLQFGAVANFLQHLPMIERILKKVLKRVVRSQIVLPNRVYVGICPKHKYDAATLRCPPPEGMLRVQLLEARGLHLPRSLVQSFFNTGDSCNPFTMMKLGMVCHESETVENSTNPNWDNNWGHFLVHNLRQHLRIKLYNDSGSGDRKGVSLGSGRFPLQQLLDAMQQNNLRNEGIWVKLKPRTISGIVGTAEATVEVRLRLDHFEISPLRDSSGPDPCDTCTSRVQDVLWHHPRTMLCIKVHTGYLMSSVSTWRRPQDGMRLHLTVNDQTFISKAGRVKSPTHMIDCDERTMQIIGALAGEGMDPTRIACVLQLEASIVEDVLNSRNRQFPIHWDQAFYLLFRPSDTSRLAITLAKLGEHRLPPMASSSLGIMEHLDSSFNLARRELVRIDSGSGPDGSCLMLDLEMQLRVVSDK